MSARPGGSVHTWHAIINLFDQDDTTAAHAVLDTGEGTVHGHGRTRRNPADTDVPEIGREVAAARALRDLADRLLEVASADIADVQHETVHLIR